MGANESKPSSAHVFKSSGPSSVSQDLVDALQSNHETDASRSRQVEAQIQARVASELKKLQQKESEALKVAHDKIAAAANAVTGDKKDEGTSSRAVNKQVEDLRRLLDDRKQVAALPEDVQKSRANVVRCLTENDRRPLDCWQEVESFKAEVKKMEQEWVNKVTS